MPRLKPVTLFFMVVFTLSGLLLLRLLWAFAGALVLGAALVSLFQPVHRFFVSRLGGRVRLAAGLTTGLLVVGVIAPLVGLVVSLSKQAYGVYLATKEVHWNERVVQLLSGDGVLAEQARSLAALVGLDASPEGIARGGAELFKTIGLSVYEQLSGAAANTLALVLDFTVMVLVVFALFTEGGRLKQWLMELSPLPSDEEEELVRRFRLIGRAVFLGNGVSSGLQGLFGGIGFAVVGLGDGLFWGTVMGLLAFLPVARASVVFVPAAGYLALQGQPGLAAAYLAYNLAYVGIVEYGLKPRLIGGTGRMNSIFVFVAILAGLKLFGLLGLFYGPLFVAMFLVLAELYFARYRDEVVGRGVAPDNRSVLATGEAPQAEHTQVDPA